MCSACRFMLVHVRLPLTLRMRPAYWSKFAAYEYSSRLMMWLKRVKYFHFLVLVLGIDILSWLRLFSKLHLYFILSLRCWVLQHTPKHAWTSRLFSWWHSSSCLNGDWLWFCSLERVEPRYLLNYLRIRLRFTASMKATAIIDLMLSHVDTRRHSSLFNMTEAFLI